MFCRICGRCTVLIDNNNNRQEVKTPSTLSSQKEQNEVDVGTLAEKRQERIHCCCSHNTTSSSPYSMIARGRKKSSVGGKKWTHIFYMQETLTYFTINKYGTRYFLSYFCFWSETFDILKTMSGCVYVCTIGVIAQLLYYIIFCHFDSHLAASRRKYLIPVAPGVIPILCPDPSFFDIFRRRSKQKEVK